MTAINRSALRRSTAKGLIQKIQDSTKRSGNKDDRFWQPTVESGSGYAEIRFLPAKTEDGLPYEKMYQHGFKIGTKWFINNCPTTINAPSPVI